MSIKDIVGMSIAGIPPRVVVGSVVRLKSGGPAMTVEAVEPDQRGGPGLEASCLWIGENGCYGQRQIAVGLLETVEQPGGNAEPPGAEFQRALAAVAKLVDARGTGMLLCHEIVHAVAAAFGILVARSTPADAGPTLQECKDKFSTVKEWGTAPTAGNDLTAIDAECEAMNAALAIEAKMRRYAAASAPARPAREAAADLPEAEMQRAIEAVRSALAWTAQPREQFAEIVDAVAAGLGARSPTAPSVAAKFTDEPGEPKFPRYDMDVAVRELLDAIAIPAGRDAAKAWNRVCLLYGRYTAPWLEVVPVASRAQAIVADSHEAGRQREATAPTPGRVAFEVTGDPLAAIDPGLYELTWSNGGTCLAAVGRDHGGSPWFAPCHWFGKIEANWRDVVGATAIRVDGEPCRPAPAEQTGAEHVRSAIENLRSAVDAAADFEHRVLAVIHKHAGALGVLRDGKAVEMAFTDGKLVERDHQPIHSSTPLPDRKAPG